MTIEQTVTIPESHTLRLDIPVTVPCGTAFLTLTVNPPDTMLLSETSLSKDWDSPEEDTAWANL